MRVIRLAGVTAGMLIVGGVVAPGPWAKIPPPPLQEVSAKPRVLEPGDPLTWTIRLATLATKQGTIQCTNGHLNGVLNTNGLKTDTFTLTGAGFEEECGTPFGKAMIHFPGPLKWQGVLKTKGVTELLGPAFSATFAQTSLTCSWAAKKVKGTFNANGQAITIAIANAKFKAVPGSSPMCPKMGALTTSASLATQLPAGGMAPVALG
jgi:hypothetical protein